MVKHIAMTLFGYQIQAFFRSQESVSLKRKLRVFTLKIAADLLGHSKKQIAIFTISFMLYRKIMSFNYFCTFYHM